MQQPTNFIGRLFYAAVCGIVVFLVVLGLGLVIVHFITNAEGASYGSTVKGLAVLLGVLWAGYVFFSGWSFPARRA